MKPSQDSTWLGTIVLQAVNLSIALLVAGVVVAFIGLSPREVIAAFVDGAFGSLRGVSYTLYYATSLIFTGLAVAVSFQAGLFNIGGEGQATLGGLGAGLVAMWLAPHLPAFEMLPLMLLASLAAGFAWAAIPALLQAYRGSQIVITTIMFNFLASSLMGYLLVDKLRAPGGMSVESLPFASSAHLPSVQEVLARVGIEWPSSPLNVSFFLAVGAAVGVHVLLWRTRLGYRLRAVGSGAAAAAYAGIDPKRYVVVAVGLSGALAGMVGMNEIAGVNGKLLLDFVGGAGFTGIAVSVMGRNHPAGIVLASLLFGALSQGGAEAGMSIPGLSRDMVVTLQGLIVLFSGAMAFVLAPTLGRLGRAVGRLRRRPFAVDAPVARGDVDE
jgi:simple sugar transport system permease protein